ncbi:MAG: hypothetical protein WC584_04630 [Candidatus Pacearchaeota archaeon]
MNLTETKKIRAIIILEVIGKPPEHLTETLESMIKNIDSEQEVRVIEKKINEPVSMKENKEFYTSFAEIEIEVEEIMRLVGLMFKYMPSHIEVISHEFIALTNNSWNDILNETIRRIHGYDEVARIIQTEKIILENKLRELMKNLDDKNIQKDESNERKKDGNKRKKKLKED